MPRKQNANANNSDSEREGVMATRRHDEKGSQRTTSLLMRHILIRRPLSPDDRIRRAGTSSSRFGDDEIEAWMSDEEADEFRKQPSLIVASEGVRLANTSTFCLQVDFFSGPNSHSTTLTHRWVSRGGMAAMPIANISSRSVRDVTDPQTQGSPLPQQTLMRAVTSQSQLEQDIDMMVKNALFMPNNRLIRKQLSVLSFMRPPAKSEVLEVNHLKEWFDNMNSMQAEAWMARDDVVLIRLRREGYQTDEAKRRVESRSALLRMQYIMAERGCLFFSPNRAIIPTLVTSIAHFMDTELEELGAHFQEMFTKQGLDHYICALVSSHSELSQLPVEEVVVKVKESFEVTVIHTRLQGGASLLVTYLHFESPMLNLALWISFRDTVETANFAHSLLSMDIAVYHDW
ncbi:hypothetical protein BDY19DRAFT_904399 [Irpex rosettiformis]|uniref:Uncharacterized protein n=1 Tax=Irpex rosettiformis TaxID=378272 RepID=A0ACB8UC62_9APHY|nr:hypothetical protein BDY19DRAFT_904399 [Irpex rosettiformis]